MIKDIQELNFPSYATLSSATVTLNDMGDRTISAQVKIDGDIIPDFSYDWEVEFKGERYIQPLRQPQASKGYESKYSLIDLTFYHKTIYDLKRYYFPKMAEVQSGTVSVDKYIADLNLNLEGFCDALQQVLDYYLEIGYFNERITINLKGKGTGIYAEEKQYIQIQYSHIWDVVQKIYDLFGVRWSIEGREIKIGYPTEEVAHTFEYGFEGGLLKVERQVQSADIRNSLLGRGGSKNLPYLYFKDLDKYGETGENGTWTPDPDAIPELRSIYFTELRGKTFRDYVQGWKTNPNRDLSYGDIVEEYDSERGESPEGWAYKAGHEDKTFNPIEYVKDDDSIAKYGLLQGGLENQEDTYPTIQGVEVDGLGRVDEIVGAEQVKVDETTSNTTSVDEKYTQEISGVFSEHFDNIDENSTKHCTFRTDVFEIEDSSIVPYLVADPSISAVWHTSVVGYYCARQPFDQCTKYGGPSTFPLKMSNLSISLFFADSDERIIDTTTLKSGVKYYIKLEADVSGFPKRQVEGKYWSYDAVSNTYWGEIEYRGTEGDVKINYSWIVENIPYNGLIIKADEEQSKNISIPKESSKTVVFTTEKFVVPKSGASNVNVPINIITDANGLFTYKTDIEAVNAKTNEIVSSINIPAGEYYLTVSVSINNNSTKSENFKVEMLSAYIILPTDSEEFKPTFYIYVKNIWNTTRNEGESNEAYTNRVWTPILGDREGNEAKVVFTTGWLAGHSDYEFVISDVEYAGDKGVQSEDGIPAEWKITLIKSDAELEATGKWIPSTTQQANVGDKFFFIGIDMPHEYTLWAEQAVDNYKADQLPETAHIKPTWVVQTDNVRLNQLQEGESELLLNALKIGNSLRLADTRFTNGIAQTLYLQSVTYTWQEGTNIVPDVEVVLSDKVTTSTNPVAKLQGEVDALTKQVGSISNIQQVVRAIGDKLYLRKDGFDEVSNSATEFNKLVSSRGYRQGAVGGNGWGLRSEQGKGIIEVDKLIVRDEMQVNSLVVNQVSAIGGKEILSAASIECSRVETTEQGFKCYFDQKRGSVANLFQINDIAYSQVFNANDIEVKYYKREVIEVGDNYILLSLEGDGSGAPQIGDVIAQYGNTKDKSRQYVIIRDVIGGGYERMLSGLNSVSASGVEYYFAGRLNGSTPRWFVGNANSDFAEWKDGTLIIKGKVEFQSGSSGLTNIDEWDAKQQQIDNAQATANQARDDASFAQQSADNAQEIAQNAIAEAKNYTDQIAKDLQDQLDGKVESFFYDYDPTLENIPASEWTTDALKAEHLNDTFTNTESSRSWRWLEKNGMYQWVEIVDTQSAEALAKAQEALGVANGKVAVFVTEDTPKTPYNEKDFWLKDGRIYRSTTTRTTVGATHIDDWVLAENSHEYTDNKLASYKTEVNATVAELDNAIATAEANAKKYTDEGKVALQESIDALESAKANIQDVYNKAIVDSKVSTAEQNALTKAQEFANVAQQLAEETAKAYADGEISASEAETLKKYQEALSEAQDAMQKANDAMDAANEAQALANSTQDELSKTNGVVAMIQTDVKGLGDDVATLNKRLDGVVENFFVEGTPTTTNYPVSEWTTDNDKINHIGDTYTNINEYYNEDGTIKDTDAGKSWRWCKCSDILTKDYVEVTDNEGNTIKLHWHPIADSDAVLALQKASQAQATADGKIRTFVVQPTPPYSVGDFWHSENERLKVCVVAKEKGLSFAESDWQFADAIGRIGENLVTGTRKSIVITGENSNGFDWPIYPVEWKLSRPLEKGKTYTLTCQSTGKWTHEHIPEKESNGVTLRVVNGVDYASVISDSNTGTTGTTFVWNNDWNPELQQRIRLNSYGISQRFWNLKIEEGNVATPWSPAPSEQPTTYTNESNDAPYSPKVGDIWIPSDTPHITKTYTANGWQISGDSTGTTINGGLITSGTIKLGDSEINAKAGITGAGTSNSSVRIWAGSGATEMDNAPFRVMQDGTMVASQADIEGRLVSRSVETGDLVIDGGGIGIEPETGESVLLDGTGLTVSKSSDSPLSASTNSVGFGSIDGRTVGQSIVYRKEDVGYIGADAIYIDVPTYSPELPDDENLNHALYIRQGHIRGLRYHFHRVGEDYNISEMDTVIRCATSGLTLTLPKDAEDGQMFIIIGYYNGSTTIATIGDVFIKTYGMNNSTTYSFVGDRTITLIYDAVNKQWYIL